MATSLFYGSIVALVTPMQAGKVNFDELKKLVEYHIASGTNAIVSVGTTGESATLSIDENIKVIQKTVEFAEGRIPVIAGTGANATSEAILMTQRLNNSGIAGCLTVVPYYNKPTQEGMYQHFKAIAESTELPQILYNVPSRTGSDLLPETVVRLAEIPNVVGIKETVPDLIDRLSFLRTELGERFSFLSGDDYLGLAAMKAGANGIISVTNNVAAADMAKMCQLALAGNFEEADVINRRLMPLHKELFIESNPIPVKWAAYRLGLISEPGLRLPLTTLSDNAQPSVLEALKQASLL